MGESEKLKGSQSCPTVRDPMDGSLPGSSVHGIFQTRVLEWGAIAFSTIILVVRQKKRSNSSYLFEEKGTTEDEMVG